MTIRLRGATLNGPREALSLRVASGSQSKSTACTIPDCGRPTMRSAGVGLAEYHCRYHVQYHARHGSHWCPTYKAADLKPYLATSTEWISEHREEPTVAHALMALRGLLHAAGQPLPAQDIKSRTAAFRARVAFARLRDAGVTAERLLAIHMGVAALVEDDLGSHRVPEFRIVQTAKAVHRLASGTHRVSEWPLDDGSVTSLEFHAYPKSSGRVLRAIGGLLDEICAGVTERQIQAIRDLKFARFGPHPSRLSGWIPLWKRKRESSAK